jgi:hypothetical protein
MHHNTLHAVQQCATDLEERMNDEATEPLSFDETQARARMFETMASMFEMLGVDVDTHALSKALNDIK